MKDNSGVKIIIEEIKDRIYNEPLKIHVVSIYR